MAVAVPTTMYAWRKHRGTSEPVWEEVPVPRPGPMEVLCRILASGVCRSDHSLLTRENQPSWFQDRFTLGHEGCGRVVHVGKEAEKCGFKEGDIVALHAVPGCGKEDCSDCSRGLAQLCQSGHHSGIGQDGFYASYACVSVRGLVHVPAGVTPSQAAVATDAVSTAYHAILRRAQVKPSEIVFLFGLGGLGFNALQIIRNIGARVIISDVKQALLDEAVRLGISPTDVVPVETKPLDFVLGHGLGNQIDTVLDFVGSHQTFEDAQHIARRGGKIACIGSLDTENIVQMKIGTRKRLSFIFSYGSQVQDLEEVLKLIADGIIVPHVQEKRLEDFPTVLGELEAGKIHGRIALVQD